MRSIVFCGAARPGLMIVSQNSSHKEEHRIGGRFHSSCKTKTINISHSYTSPVRLSILMCTEREKNGRNLTSFLVSVSKYRQKGGWQGQGSAVV